MPEKEIGKLLELLNEYSKEIGYFNEEDLQGQTKAWILSKEFGWIKWLVENDKIDLDACEGEKTYNNLTASRDSNYSQYERLLMALAIQDEPIRFLCEILK